MMPIVSRLASTSVSQQTTTQPRAANCIASSRPIPWPAPVICSSDIKLSLSLSLVKLTLDVSMFCDLSLMHKLISRTRVISNILSFDIYNTRGKRDLFERFLWDSLKRYFQSGIYKNQLNRQMTGYILLSRSGLLLFLEVIWRF